MTPWQDAILKTGGFAPIEALLTRISDNHERRSPPSLAIAKDAPPIAPGGGGANVQRISLAGWSQAPRFAGSEAPAAIDETPEWLRRKMDVTECSRGPSGRTGVSAARLRTFEQQSAGLVIAQRGGCRRGLCGRAADLVQAGQDVAGSV